MIAWEYKLVESGEDGYWPSGSNEFDLEGSADMFMQFFRINEAADGWEPVCVMPFRDMRGRIGNFLMLRRKKKRWWQL